MGAKKKLSNKGNSPKVETPKAVVIDWDNIKDPTIIIGKGGKLEDGKEYQVTKATAKLIVEAGKADLK